MSLIEKTTEIGNSIIALIDAKTGGAPDGKTVKSTDGVMSAIGVKESNKDKAIKTWVGTLAEYEALESVDENTLYNITDDVEGEEVFNTTKVNLDGSNYEGSGLQTVVDSNLNSKMTNCITEIPQRIKYTLVDGTLTIKAGSVVIVPYGTEDKTAEFPVGARFLHDDFKVHDTQFADGKFFVWAEFVNDSSSSRATTDTYERFLNIFVTVDTHIQGGLSNSSGTEPIKNHMMYNPETNLIQYYENSDAMTVLCDVCALPWGRCKANGTSVFGEILQVFDGVGYIGSTVWVDKGVKGLIPNGRNEDGSLRNWVRTNPILKIANNTAYSYVSKWTHLSALNENNNTGQRQSYKHFEQPDKPDVSNMSTTATWLNTVTNEMWKTDDRGVTWARTYLCKIGCYWTNGTTISEYKKHEPVEVLKTVDAPEISSYAMPSEKYIDLTLGASGETYIAPANGWFALHKVSGANGKIIVISNTGGDFGSSVMSSGANQIMRVYVPFKKGQAAYVAYDATGATNVFRFIYAQGEV